MTDLTTDLVELCISFGQLEPLQTKRWVVTSVPLHPSRERQRGFNQASLLAQGLTKYLNWECAPDIIKKTRATAPQAKLSDGKRRKNLTAAFTINSPEEIKNKYVLLVDDFWATGTTAKECAKVLKKSGVKKVWMFTLARG